MKTFYMYEAVGNEHRYWGTLFADNWVDARVSAVSLWGIAFGDVVAASTQLPSSIVME